jgi:enamine deaminase RidA (YjgF/YER057c/UK114 family)
MLSLQPVKITREASKHCEAITADRDGFQERFISARSDGSEDELAIFDGLVPPSDNVVAQMVFGGCGFHDAALTRMAGADCPLLWVQGDVCSGTHVSGTQTFVLDGQTPRRLVLDGRVVGSMWSDADADYCLLAGILPTDLTAKRGEQTTSSFEQIEAALQQAGMDFSHVVRTWLYLDDLLTWYGEFNDARTEFFKSRGVFERLIPASTGIGASNPAGAALLSGALAIRPRRSGVRIQEVESPLQRPATEYRSSFSRAVEVATPDRRWLTISGTASIAADGKSMFAGDVVKQIHLTLDVVEAILRSRGMDWSNATRAVGYFRDIRALPVFDACCHERGMSPLPLAPAHATVCRADLLFEMELDAIAAL